MLRRLETGRGDVKVMDSGILGKAAEELHNWAEFCGGWGLYHDKILITLGGLHEKHALPCRT